MKFFRRPIFTIFIFLLLLCIFSRILPAQNIQLEIEGTLQIKEGAAENRLLQSNAEGLGFWVKPINQQRKIIDVKDFGAVADHSTDNTDAFQAAIDSAATFGGVVFIPAGDYVLRNGLKVPGGVMLEGESVGGDYHKFSNTVRGSCLIYTGLDYLAEFSGFFSGAKNLYFYNSATAGSKAEGCLKLVANDGSFSTGYTTFSNLYMFNFFEGTGLMLAATNNSSIAHVLVEDLRSRFPNIGMHILAETGSTIQHITLLNGKISGGLEYGLRNQGGTNINAYGTTFEGIGCGSVGHLVVESGNINAYGFRIESTDPAGRCDEAQIIIAHFFPNTKNSYLRGLTGDGRVIDEGENHLDVTGKNIGRRPSGYNEFQNSAFRGIQNNLIPHWNITGNFTDLQVQDPVFEDNHQVIKMVIPAGEIISLSPNTEVMPKVLLHQYGSFGAYIKTAAANVAFCRINAYSSSTNTCSEINSSFHAGDSLWHFIGLPAGMNKDICDSNPRFVFDNSSNANPDTLSITTPSFVFGNVRPSLLAKPLLASGGIINGTLTEGMVSLPIIVFDDFEFILPTEGNTFLLTDVNPIHRLNNSTSLGRRFPKGTIITLLFESAGVSVKHSAFIKLLGLTNYTSKAGSTLTLLALDAGTWQEIGRNL